MIAYVVVARVVPFGPGINRVNVCPPRRVRNQEWASGNCKIKRALVTIANGHGTAPRLRLIPKNIAVIIDSTANVNSA
jgi:hypothetical protein